MVAKMSKSVYCSTLSSVEPGWIFATSSYDLQFNCSLKANTVVVPTQAPLAEVNDTKKDEAPEVKEDKLAPVVFEDIPLQLR